MTAKLVQILSCKIDIPLSTWPPRKIVKSIYLSLVHKIENVPILATFTMRPLTHHVISTIEQKLTKYFLGECELPALSFSNNYYYGYLCYIINSTFIIVVNLVTNTDNICPNSFPPLDLVLSSNKIFEENWMERSKIYILILDGLIFGP